MAKNNNLTDFLTDVANAIREKDGSTGTINPQNFSDKIKAIQTGVDTSDGNIEPTTVLKGYKGYAKGVAVNGAIETYDGTVEDVVVVYTDCLTFTGETSEFTLKATNKRWDGTLQWSTDHNTWTTLSGTETMQSVGKKLYLRGKGNTEFGSGLGGVSWVLSAKAGCTGNIQTLFDWENPPTNVDSYAFNGMFYNCTNLTTAPSLPATSITTCSYWYMFYGCTSLKVAPELPAKTLAFGCYYSMFEGCTSLETAPELPATTLNEQCYRFLFKGCSKLKVNTSTGCKIFTCPSSIPSNAVTDMFTNTGGSFTGTPTAGTTYYYTL